jgi:hypothetical protein
MATDQFLATGYGQSLQWLPPFALIDATTGTTLFSVDSSGNVTSAGTISGGGSSTGTFATLVVTGTSSFGGLMTSTVAAGSNVFKFIKTNATPTVTWVGSSGTAINSTAPAGYLQINDGTATGYIPYWH